MPDYFEWNVWHSSICLGWRNAWRVGVIKKTAQNRVDEHIFLCCFWPLIKRGIKWKVEQTALRLFFSTSYLQLHTFFTCICLSNTPAAEKINMRDLAINFGLSMTVRFFFLTSHDTRSSWNSFVNWQNYLQVSSGGESKSSKSITESLEKTLKHPSEVHCFKKRI